MAQTKVFYKNGTPEQVDKFNELVCFLRKYKIEYEILPARHFGDVTLAIANGYGYAIIPYEYFAKNRRKRDGENGQESEGIMDIIFSNLNNPRLLDDALSTHYDWV